MLLRRISKHVSEQNWFAVFIDFLIVVFGVYIGVWIGGFQERQGTLQKQKLVVESLRQDLLLVGSLGLEFSETIEQGLVNYSASRSNGEMPPPFYFRLPGSDTPPQAVWTSLQQSQLTDLFSPGLLNDLGFYYSELDGVSQKYLRYVVFVENEVLPGLKEDARYFYVEDGMRLKGKFAANMDRLRDWRDENKRLIAWSECLAVRLETPMAYTETCIPELATPVVQP